MGNGKDGVAVEARSARMVAVCVGEEKQLPKEAREEAFCRVDWGLEGDVHGGPGGRQLSLLRVEDVREAERENGCSFPPGTMAENLVIEGLPEDLGPGWTLRAPSGAILEVRERGKRPDEPHTYSYRGHCLLPRVGFFLTVRAEGVLRPGDEIQAFPPAPAGEVVPANATSIEGDGPGSSGAEIGAGRVHVYTGKGKGKTTAALGLALRAAGHGHRVGIVQFMKGWPFYGEIEGLARLGIRLERTGRPDYVRRGGDVPLDHREAARGLALATEWLASGDYDLVVLDEINVAADYGLLGVEAVLAALAGRSPRTEVVLTGRYAPAAFLEAADYVTEMREEKHPYRSGLRAREGVEY